MVLFSFKTVSAVTVTQTFDNVFITYETEDGYKETNAINVITYSGNYLYKLYFGEVSTNGYELYSDDYLKFGSIVYLNKLIDHTNQINTDGNDKWYYVAQYKIYSYIYSDYDVYFSDSEGTKISFLEEEIAALNALMLEKVYDITEYEIYNNQILPFEATAYSRGSNADLTKTEDGYTIAINSGTETNLDLSYVYNEDEDTILYVNSDNFILIQGGGYYSESQTITLKLANASFVTEDNPVTGNINPFVPVIIGVPVIILGGIIYKKTRRKNS